jgi:hypothetical protein
MPDLLLLDLNSVFDKCVQWLAFADQRRIHNPLYGMVERLTGMQLIVFVRFCIAVFL